MELAVANVDGLLKEGLVASAAVAGHGAWAEVLGDNGCLAAQDSTYYAHAKHTCAPCARPPRALAKQLSQQATFLVASDLPQAQFSFLLY